MSRWLADVTTVVNDCVPNQALACSKLTKQDVDVTCETSGQDR